MFWQGISIVLDAADDKWDPRVENNMDEVRGVATNAFAPETLIFLREINVLRTTDREPRIENNMDEDRGFSTNAFAQENVDIP